MGQKGRDVVLTISSAITRALLLVQGLSVYQYHVGNGAERGGRGTDHFECHYQSSTLGTRSVCLSISIM